MRYLKKLNEGFQNLDNYNKLLNEVKDVFLSLSDDIHINICSSYFMDNNVDRGRRVDFNYGGEFIKNLDKLTQKQFEEFIDTNPDNFRLAISGRFVLAYSNKSRIDYRTSKMGSITGENGALILDIEKFTKRLEIISLESAEIYGRMTDIFEDVKITNFANAIEIIGMCSKEQTKKIGLIEEIFNKNAVWYEL